MKDLKRPSFSLSPIPSVIYIYIESVHYALDWQMFACCAEQLRDSRTEEQRARAHKIALLREYVSCFLLRAPATRIDLLSRAMYIYTPHHTGFVLRNFLERNVRLLASDERLFFAGNHHRGIRPIYFNIRL